MTKPKHKRVLHDSTPQGLPRWLRAADNAVRNPNSPGAKLYYRRVANAQRVRERYGSGEPVVFFRSIPRASTRREAIACSTFCAALHVQKAYLEEFRNVQEGTKPWTNWQGEVVQLPNYVRYERPVPMDEIVNFLEQDPRNALLAHSGITLKRPVRCVVCWTPVKP